MLHYFMIGKLAASHGLQGELILQHNLGKAASLKNLETIFIEKEKDNFFPYFITKTTGRSADEVLIKLEGIDNKEEARKLTPQKVWVTKEDFDRFVKKSAPISLLGYILFGNGKDLGEIIEVIEQPGQLICVIMYQQKEVLIPVHDDNLQKIDNRHKKVYVNIPDGLLEIYL